MNGLTDLLTPEQHGRLLHPVGARGQPILAFRDGGRWRHMAVPVADIETALASLRNVPDVYLSQNRFWGARRRVAQVAELDALFSDLDYYRLPELADWHPWRVLEAALRVLEEAGIPAPTFAIATGRGVVLVWLHTPVPRQALPRWNAAQRVLSEVLRPLSADPLARDAARVLRLIGTVNSKVGRQVEALSGPGAVWSFDTLCDEVLPLTRAELHAQRLAKTRSRRLWIPGEEQLTAAMLWEPRLTDLQHLLELRWFGQLPPGQRDAWLFVAGNAMAWLTELKSLRRELFHLAREVTQTGRVWVDGEARSRLQAVMDRAAGTARGETVEWPPGTGRRVDPRYRLRTDTIIDWLGISPEEQAEMRALVGPEIRRERHRQNEERRRRDRGVTERRLYEAQAAHHRELAHRLRSAGLSLRAVGAQLGVSVGAVHWMLRDDVLADAAARDPSPGDPSLKPPPRTTGPRRATPYIARTLNT